MFCAKSTSYKDVQRVMKIPNGKRDDEEEKTNKLLLFLPTSLYHHYHQPHNG